MTKTSQIDFLNSVVKMRLAPSKIHGIGVFAMRDIPKGTKLFADRAPMPFSIPKADQIKLFPEVKSYLLERWVQLHRGEVFIYPDVNYQGYMNHADDPNYDCSLDVTLRDIAKGEEITEDYRQISGWEEVFPFIK